MRARIAQFDEAVETVGHTSDAKLGDPTEHLNRVAAMWSAIAGVDLDEIHVAQMMVAFNLSRLANHHYDLDSYVDIVKYTRLAVLCGPRFDGNHVAPDA
jgi:hypothetical protein